MADVLPDARIPGPERHWPALLAAVVGADWARTSGAGTGARPLDGVCRAFAEDLPVDGMAMSVMTEIDIRETVGLSDPIVELVEDEQYRLGVGPVMTRSHPIDPYSSVT